MQSPPVAASPQHTKKKGILERLDAGEIVIGDGGFVIALEKRGYVKAGPWTPEAAVEHPEAVRQLHREFLRAGSNVLQTFTFYASEDKLENRGNYVADKISGQTVNEAACDIAKEVAKGEDALVAGGVSQTPTYLSGRDEAEVKAIFRQQLDVFVKKNVDFLIAEYFEHIEEAAWAVETLKESGKPVAATMCIGPEGDLHGVPPGECAVQLVKAGASIVGVNCHFDPETCLRTVKLMKEGLEAAKLKAHLMSQPLAFHTPDCGKQGFIDLPEFPFALEPRIVTRWDVQKYAREAYNLGIRYIGGCCGFEPYHIRAIAEELAPERGFLPLASEKHGSWGSDLSMHTKPWVRARARKEYWENLMPASGRPYCPSMSKPDNWGVTKGAAELMQQKEATTEQQLKELFKKQKFKSNIVA
ncbi:betaine--homocysteine S-methyltransferase 1 [Gopherus flavomarginatus]|uniref:betaine--homocysteine S-methyltransferase 1 n=1 Tax=Gopherus flavomarginatus TaxID=286002 RepID=UPI0021CC0BBA|nr:betaine--homocysteine S-methyltransferase 1 [Gopherus flavomarginatus]